MEIDIQVIIGADVISHGSGGHGCASSISNAQRCIPFKNVLNVDLGVGPAIGKKIVEAVLEAFKENLRTRLSQESHVVNEDPVIVPVCSTSESKLKTALEGSVNEFNAAHVPIAVFEVE
jgi:hypothetical protein